MLKRIISTLISGLLLLTACQDENTSAKVGGNNPTNITAPPQQGQPQFGQPQAAVAGTGSVFGHVVIVTEENTNYSNVTTSSMPYLMGLAQQYGLATQYYANTHP